MKFSEIRTDHFPQTVNPEQKKQPVSRQASLPQPMHGSLLKRHSTIIEQVWFTLLQQFLPLKKGENDS